MFWQVIEDSIGDFRVLSSIFNDSFQVLWDFQRFFNEFLK